MKVLALDSSGLVASVAVVCDDRLLGEYTINYKKTHSQTLLPMLQQVADMIELDLQSVDAIAVAAGPGSFTGLRIGSATAKGMGLALNKPIIPVPTVDALAYNLWGSTHLICPMMDARRSQVYTGLYEFTEQDVGMCAEAESFGESVSGDNVLMDTTIPAEAESARNCVLDDAQIRNELINCGNGWMFRRVLPACAIAVDELMEHINELKRPVIFLGDGVPVCREQIGERICVAYSYAPPMSSLQRAASVASLGMLLYKEGHYEDAASHKPDYLRPSQAEREFAGKQRDFRV